MPLFITFEGIEGCGKSTQIRTLTETLRFAGHKVVLTREPGGCPLSDSIRAILLDSANAGMCPETELLLYAAARAQHVAEIIRPALARGEIVLCDRFTDATVAYQGYGRSLRPELIDHLNDIATSGLTPDLTILLDFSSEEGLRRAKERNSLHTGTDEGRFEAEAIDFHQRVRKGYLELARRHERFHVVDASGTRKDVAERIANVVNSFLHKEHA